VLARLLAANGHRVERVVGPLDALARQAGAADVVRVAVVHGACDEGAARRAKAAFAAAGGRTGCVTGIAVAPLEVRERGRILDGGAAARTLGSASARFALVGTAPGAPVRLDVERLATDRIDNPWVSVRHARARIARVAAARCAERADLDRLGEPERECLRGAGMQADVLELAARRLEPDRLVAHASGLAAAFHRYYNRGRYLDADPTTVRARAALACGVDRALDDTLGLLALAGEEQG
jgi:arginyl-tRNA synthetase